MKNIIFIHDAFHNSKSWKKWVAFFKKKGYNCLTPEWPNSEIFYGKMDQHFSKEEMDLAVEEVYKEFENITKSVKNPILIGHARGGLVVQRLICTGLGIAGVCVDSAEPDSMQSFDWGFLDHSIMISNPYKGDELFFADFESFHEKFCQSFSVEEAKALFYMYTHQDQNKSDWNYIDNEDKSVLGEPHPPLLFINSEGKFLMQMQKEINSENAICDDKQADADDEYYICGPTDWKELAISIYDWLQQHEVITDDLAHS